MSARVPGIWTLAAVEAQKLLGRRWLVLGALAAPALAVAFTSLAATIEAAQQAILSGRPAGEALQVDTAFAPTARALVTGATVAAVIAALAGALALSEERRLGTLRTLLAGPVPRWRFFLAKAAGLAVLSLILVGSTCLVALASGALQGDFVAGVEWEYEDHTVAGMWRTFVIAAALSWAAVTFAALLGLLASALASSGASAIITLAIAVALMQSASSIGAPATRKLVRALTPLTYVQRPGDYLGEQVSCIRDSSWCIVLLSPERIHWEARIPWLVLITASVIVAGLGLIVFTRREIL